MTQEGIQRSLYSKVSKVPDLSPITIIYSTSDLAKGHASSRLYHYLFAIFDSELMVDHEVSTISHKGRRAATFISIYIVYLIPCEWWIMRFLTISHKGRRAVTFISIYVVYLIPREWQIMRFSTILHKGRRAAYLYYYLSCIF